MTDQDTLNDRQAALRHDSEALAANFPALLADAEHLAATLMLGDHGRRRPGMGDEFWQYRPAEASDEARAIDWRRSARSDALFIREKEWQAAQSILMWVDDAQSMDFSSAKLPTKADRARVLAMATAVLLLRGGERVGMTGHAVPPRRGNVQLLRIASHMMAERSGKEFGAPNLQGLMSKSRAVFFSDFLGAIEPVEQALTEAADLGVRGALVQVLDPTEEAFPFNGRTVFESMGGAMSHETLEAVGLRDRYLNRLAERKARLADLAQLTGWQYFCHHTGESAQAALLWIYGALEPRH